MREDLPGESVTVEERGPPTARRMFAALIDFTILIIAAQIVFPGYNASVSRDAETNPFAGGWHLETAVLLGLPYFLACEVLFARTLGKALLRVHVAGLTGPASRGRLIVRNVARVLWLVPMVMLLLDVGLIESTEKRQRLGDLIAGTIIVRS